MRYATIVADPPWTQRNAPVWIRPTKAGRPSSVVEQPLPYPTLSLAAICDLPVAELAEKSANLFLWTTNQYLSGAFTVLEAWGFGFSQTLVWHKTNVAPFAGRGSFAPLDVEFVLVGRRGSARFEGRADSSVFTARRSDTNSAKPELFLDLVESISPGPYLELFARRNRFGWDTWGNESLEMVSGL